MAILVAQCLYIRVYPGESQDSLLPLSGGGIETYCYWCLKRVLESAPYGSSLVVLGELNAHIGRAVRPGGV